MKPMMTKTLAAALVAATMMTAPAMAHPNCYFEGVKTKCALVSGLERRLWMAMNDACNLDQTVVANKASCDALTARVAAETALASKK